MAGVKENIVNAFVSRRTCTQAAYAVITQDHVVSVVHHQTVVIKHDTKLSSVTLANGGYFTLGTKGIINACLAGIEAPLVQGKLGKWSIDGRPWSDGMTVVFGRGNDLSPVLGGE